MLKKEKDGSLFKDTKLAHPMMLACLDEFLKIAEGVPVGQLVNQSDSFLSGLELPPGGKKDKGQFPSTLGVPLHDPPAPPEDTEPPAVVDSMSKLQSSSEEKQITTREAEDAFRRLRGLERSAPSKGSLMRGAAVGALAAPAVGALVDVISPKALGGGAAPKIKMLRSLGRGTRKILGRSVQGAAYGGALPYARHRLEREAEMQKLREYVGEKKRGKLRGKIRKATGL